MLDIGLYVCYIMMAVAVVAAIAFFFIETVKTPGALVKTLIGLGAVLALFGVGYALSDDAVPSAWRGMYTATEIKLISAALIMFYVTLVIAIIAIVYSEITKAFSNG